MHQADGGIGRCARRKFNTLCRRRLGAFHYRLGALQGFAGGLVCFITRRFGLQRRRLGVPVRGRDRRRVGRRDGLGRGVRRQGRLRRRLARRRRHRIEVTKDRGRRGVRRRHRFLGLGQIRLGHGTRIGRARR